MIPHVSSNRFGQLLRDTRERLALRQEDIAERLGIDRTMINKWEHGNFKRPAAVDDINELALYTGVPVLEWVRALGYDVRLERIESEAGAALLRAFLTASDDRRQIAQLALGLGPELSGGGFLESLRRLAAMDSQDRRESQE